MPKICHIMDITNQTTVILSFYVCDCKMCIVKWRRKNSVILKIFKVNNSKLQVFECSIILALGIWKVVPELGVE